MARVICDYCAQVVDDKTISAQIAKQINNAFVRYTCQECQTIDSSIKALSESILDNPDVQLIPDKVFIDILRMRGYNGTLKKSNVVLI